MKRLIVEYEPESDQVRYSSDLTYVEILGLLDLLRD
jgi:hypothetical protein